MKKTRFILTALLCGSVLLNTVPVTAEGGSPEDFDRWMEEEFIEAMEEDYVNMHFTVRDHQALGIEKPELKIGEVGDLESYAEEIKDIEDTLKELEQFDYEKLSDAQKADYDIYKTYLVRLKELNSFPMMDFYFLPTGGITDNLTTNFSEFKFYEKTDFEDYLTVLSTVDEYVDEALELTRTQAKNGYFMTDSALDKTEEAIDRFVEKTDNNELIVVFEKNVDAFEGLSAEEKETYKKKNRDIILNSYIPAYKKAKTELEKLRGSRSSQGGMAELKDGKAYFEAYAKFKTSSEDSVESLLKLCEQYLKSAFAEYYMLMTTSSADLEEKVRFTTPEEILKYLEDNLKKDFPEGPELRYTASYLDPSVANDNINAYYLNPPVDDITDNVIKINGTNVTDINEMYETLSHEGFPGHCYQITWFLDTKPAHLRSAISNIGYTEGWAMYVEDWAWRNSGLSRDAADASRLNTGISYVLNAAADLGVNGLGWTKKDLSKWIQKQGFNDSMTSGLYTFVCESPGVILPYGVGFAKFWELKKDCEKLNGFSLKDFNKVLLTNGDRPFELVRKDVDQYITSLTGKTPDKTPTPTPVPYPVDGDDGEIDQNAEGRKWVMYGGIAAIAAALLIIVLALASHRKVR